MVQNINELPPKLASKYNLDNAENCEMKDYYISEQNMAEAREVCYSLLMLYK